MSKSWIMSSFEEFVANNSSKENSNRRRLPSTSQKHVIRDDELWATKFCPVNLDSLCVHKKKVSEVEAWLRQETSVKTKGKNLLLLTGPSGCGKTTTVKLLCRHLNISIQEWINPSTFSASSENGVAFGVYQGSQISMFRNFLLRANKYSSLLNDSKSSKRVVLIKDFPNVIFRDQTEFQTLLRKYRQTARSPIIFIVTDNVGNDQNERLLFPKNFQSELDMSSINFNPVSNTLLTKALNLVIKAAESQKLKIPPISKSTKDKVIESSNGDLRSAVNTLQFSYTHYGNQSIDNPAPAKSRKRTKKSNNPIANMDVSNEFFYGRDVSLSLFRAIGKILYCKRSDSEKEQKLPSHLECFSRRPIIFNPEEVIGQCYMSPEWFNLFLHQNYLQFFDDVDDLVRATEYLSDADFLMTDWTGKNVMELYSSSVAARGLMHSNRNGKPGGWRPLHKPEFHTAITTKKRNELDVKNSISELLKSRMELFTDYIPFVKYFDLPSCYCNGSMTSLRKLSTMNNNKNFVARSRKELLNENDIALLDETSNLEVESHGHKSSQVTLDNDGDSIEDFLIEEFSD